MVTHTRKKSYVHANTQLSDGNSPTGEIFMCKGIGWCVQGTAQFTELCTSLVQRLVFSHLVVCSGVQVTC